MTMTMRQATCCSALLAVLVFGGATARAEAPPEEHAALATVHLVGVIISTGQALLWDAALDEYVLARPGQRFRGYVIRRVLSDRIVLSFEERALELRLDRANVVTARSGAAERRGEPAPILTAPEGLTRPGAPAAAAAAPQETPAQGIVPQETPAPATAPQETPTPATPSQERPAPASPQLEEAMPAAAPGAAPEAESDATPEAAPEAESDATPEANPEPAATRRSVLPPEEPAPPPPPLKSTVRLDAVRDEVSTLIQGQAGYRAAFAPSGGVLVSAVTRGSLAQRLGLRDGDLVVSVGGVQLRDADTAMNAYLTLSVGKVVDVVLIRNGVQQILRVSIA